ncbi:MAG: glycosyltransferase [Gemmatimonadaceae bacterium]
MTAASTAATPSLADRLLLPPHATPLRADRDALPSRLRPDAAVGVLDSSEWFGPTSGGVRTYLLQKAAYVERRPWLRQVIVVPGAHGLVGDGDGVRCHQLRSPAVPRQAPYRALLDRRAVRRVALHERPDVIEAGSPLMVPWLLRGPARELDVPLVCYHHGLLPHNFAPDPRAASGLAAVAVAAAWRYLRHLDGRFAVTLVGSEFAAGELRGAGIERTAVVPLGVDLARFRPERRERAAGIRALHGLPVDRPLFGFLGRFSSEKGLEVVLRAWPEVARKRDAALVLVGDGPQRRRLTALADGLPVYLLPFVDDREALADLVASFDVFLSPGAIETFGLAALEAMASGVPVLTADRGGVAEQVRRSAAGASFRSGDAAALAAAAVAMVDADRASLGARARAHAEREHDWDVVFDRLFAVYESVRRGGDPTAAAAAERVAPSGGIRGDPRWRRDEPPTRRSG